MLSFVAVGLAVLPAPAQADFAGRVDIGGRSLYVECRGKGKPTVVLEAGLRSRGDFWNVALDAGANPATVLDGVARFTRVCEYDRPGTTLGTSDLSRSDPVRMPRTARQATDDLNALLRKAWIRGPYVLAGHSTGGLFVQLYARRYPRRMVGLVLVDALAERLESAFKPAGWSLFKRLNTEPPPGLEGYADLEIVDFDTCYAQLRRARMRKPLRGLPLTVIADRAQRVAVLRAARLPADVRARVADRPTCPRAARAEGAACVRRPQRALRHARSPAAGDQGDPARGRRRLDPLGTAQRGSAAQAASSNTGRRCSNVCGFASSASCSLTDTTAERRPFGVEIISVV